MGKRAKLSQIRVGQLVKISEQYVNTDKRLDPEFKTVETFVRIGRVKAVSMDKETISLNRGGTMTDFVIYIDDSLRLEILEDSPFNMQPGYYRYPHVKQGVTAIVHFDGHNFGHSDLSEHKPALDYFGFDPVKSDVLFERIVQS
jgi:hypothetical protein